MFCFTTKNYPLTLATSIFPHLLELYLLKLLHSYAYYHPEYLNCMESYLSDATVLYALIGCCLSIFAPMFILVSANVIIVYITAKSGGKAGRSVARNRITVLTVSAICWVFILSYGTIMIDVVFGILNLETPTWFKVLCVYSLSINVIGNPIVYTITNTRFRRYVIALFTMSRRRRRAVWRLTEYGDIAAERRGGTKWCPCLC